MHYFSYTYWFWEPFENWDTKPIKGERAMKFLFQCPCCSCFCFMKPKKGKPQEKKAAKGDWTSVSSWFYENFYESLHLLPVLDLARFFSSFFTLLFCCCNLSIQHFTSSNEFVLLPFSESQSVTCNVRCTYLTIMIG